MQPWKVYVLHGRAKQDLEDAVANQIKLGVLAEESEYDIYPPDIKPHFHARRKQLAVEMYSLLNVAYSDHAGRMRQLMKNFTFFGAPVGFIFTIDKQCGPGQFVDLGMFMQTIMLVSFLVGEWPSV